MSVIILLEYILSVTQFMLYTLPQIRWFSSDIARSINLFTYLLYLFTLYKSSHHPTNFYHNHQILGDFRNSSAFLQARLLEILRNPKCYAILLCKIPMSEN